MIECNRTLEDLTVDNEVRYDFGLTFHEIGLDISAAFGLVSIVVAGYMIIQHARHYLVPEEQKHIIRILLMIPIYSTVSFLSYYFYKHAIYFDVLRDCYEAFAIASFFTLVCNYIAPNLHAQKDYFRKQKPKNWILPINWFQRLAGGLENGWLRKPRSGLTWFNIIYVCVFQYCFIRVLFTIVSVVSQYFDRYCEASLNPGFAHVWVMGFEGASVTVAMYALIQFYIQVKDDIAEHRPFLKILCIKLVIFFSFWQTLVISALTSKDVIKTSPHLSYPDISIGLPSLLLCIEMAFFSVLHIFAFSWKPYSLKHIGAKDANSAVNFPGPGFSGKPEYKGGVMGTTALLEAFNPWDIVKASARGFRWLFVGASRRKNDPSYQNDANLEPLDTELRNRSQPKPPIIKEPAQSHAASDGYAVNGPQGAYPPSGETAYQGPGYPVSPTPNAMPDASQHLHPASRTTTVASWQHGDDDGAWDEHVHSEHEQDSTRHSLESEGREALLRNAGQPGHVVRGV